MIGPGGVRDLAARWVVTAELQLLTATHLGDGETDDVLNMVLLRDRVDHRPLLTGASLAGALRSYLNDLAQGYENPEPLLSVAARLLGDEDHPSPLIVFDSRAAWPDKSGTEVRQGIAIDTDRGTVVGPPFEIEVLPPGSTFLLRFDLVVEKGADEGQLLDVLTTALKGLERGDVGLGARRSRGLGACQAVKWRAQRFDLTSRDGWLAWLTSDHEHPNRGAQSVRDPIAALTRAKPGLRLERPPDLRERAVIAADLQFKGGLLVQGPGMEAVHTHAGGRAILQGTGVAGALRGRALRIARSVRADTNDAEFWVKRLFGSRIRVSDETVDDGVSLRQTRARGDRFTGGGIEGGQVDEEPVVRGRARLRWELRRPRPGELGLLLLVLKDLLTGDLPLGGGSAVGRGVARGRAELRLPGHNGPIIFDPLIAAASEVQAQLNALVEEFRVAPPIAEGP